MFYLESIVQAVEWVVSQEGSDGDIDRSVQYVEVDLTKVGKGFSEPFFINDNLGSIVDREVFKVTCNICLQCKCIGPDLLRVISKQKCTGKKTEQKISHHKQLRLVITFRQ